MSHWLEIEAKRGARNLLIVNALCLAVLVIGAGVERRYLKNFIQGCRPISADELGRIQSLDEVARNFVTVTGEKSVATGYQWVERSESGRTSVKNEYMALMVEDRILLIKAKDATLRAEFSGQLVPTTAELDNALRQELASKPQVAQRLFPFMLDASDYRNQGYVSLGIGLPLLLLCGWNASKAIRRLSEPQLCRVWKQASIFGNLPQISMQIGAEEPQGTRYGRMTLTPTWMVYRTWFSTWISPVNDLIWAYKKTTKHYHNGIPTGKSYTAVLIGAHKQQVEVQSKQKKVDALLEELARRVPWAVVGFNPQLESAWKNDPAGFIAFVAERKTGKPAAAATSASESREPALVR